MGKERQWYHVDALLDKEGKKVVSWTVEGSDVGDYSPLIVCNNHLFCTIQGLIYICLRKNAGVETVSAKFFRQLFAIDY